MTLKKWNCKPFCSPVPARRLKQNYECHPCAFCGSVIVVGGDLLRQAKKYERVFCDIQCAGEYKKSHNRKAEYRDKYNASEYAQERAIRVEKSKNDITRRKSERQLVNQLRDAAKWSCCCWCFKPYKNTQKTKCCSCKCLAEKTATLRKIGLVTWDVTYEIICERCNKVHVTPHDYTRFCSERCRAKASKSNREHRKRTTSFGSVVSLGNLIKKYKGRCVVCGIKCTQSDGTSKDSEATIDHIVPLSRGGLHIQSNVQLMCRRCNYIKNDTVKDGTQLMLNLEYN